jgi:hypothetical protein
MTMGLRVESGCEDVISICAEADPESASNSRSRAKSKAAGRSARSTQAGSRSKSTAAGEGARSTLTPKQLGEIAEAEFIAKAVGMGFVVAKPWGDSEPYDFIVNPKKSLIFWRVQVKSAHTIGQDGGCSFRAHDHEQKSYTAESIDALVAYARPMNAWYVMPVRVVEELKSLMLYPESKKLRSRFEKWREKWEVLRKAVRRGRRK